MLGGEANSGVGGDFRTLGNAFQSFLFRLIHSKAFGKYVNECGMGLMKMTTIDTLLASSVINPDADLKKT